MAQKLWKSQSWEPQMRVFLYTPRNTKNAPENKERVLKFRRQETEKKHLREGRAGVTGNVGRNQIQITPAQTRPEPFETRR